MKFISKKSTFDVDIHHYVEYLKSNTWEELRQQAVKQANHRCQLCQAAYEIVHHVMQPQKYEEDDLTNLLVVCGTCYTKLSEEDPVVQSTTAKKEVALPLTASTPAKEPLVQPTKTTKEVVLLSTASTRAQVPVVEPTKKTKEVVLPSIASTPPEEELVVKATTATKKAALLSTGSTPPEEDPIVPPMRGTKKVVLPSTTSTPPIVALSQTVTSSSLRPPRPALHHRSFLQRYGGCLFAEKVIGVAQNYFFYVFLLSKQERLLMIIQEPYHHKQRFAGDYIAISEEGLLDFNTYFNEMLELLKVRAEKSKNKRDFFTNQLHTDHSTYFFDAKIAVNGQQYLKISHSQGKDRNNVKRSHIMILEEEFDPFTSGLNRTMNFLLKRENTKG